MRTNINKTQSAMLSKEEQLIALAFFQWLVEAHTGQCMTKLKFQKYNSDKAKEWIYSYSKFLDMNVAELFCKNNCFIVDNGA